MELTEETLKTIERLSRSGWQADAETVLALVAEIERQREEIAALREAMTEIKTDATENMGSVMDIAHYSFKRLARMASEALGDDDNAPAPEIKVGDRPISPDAQRFIDILKSVTPKTTEIKAGDRVLITSGADTGVTCMVVLEGTRTVTVIMPDGKYVPFMRDQLEKL